MSYLKESRFYIALVLFALSFILWGVFSCRPPAREVSAIGIYPPGALLQTGDVTSAHIRDGTIVNADVSSTAAIAASKVAATTSLQFVTTGTQTFAGVKTFSSIPATTGGNCVAGNDLCNKTYVDANAGTINITAFASSSIPRGGAVYIVETDSNMATTTTSSGARNATCDNNIPCRVAQSFQIITTSTISRIGYWGAVHGAPGGFVQVDIQSNGTSTPSNTVLASTTFAAADLPTAKTYLASSTRTTTTLSTATTYWIVWSSTNGTGNDYFEVGGHTNDPYKRGSSLGDTGTGWNVASSTLNANDMSFDLYTGNTSVDIANATLSQTATTTIGTAQAAITAGTSGTIGIGGVANAIPGTVAAGRLYFLSNNNGTLELSPGTISRKVGIGLSSSTILLTPQW